MTDLLALARKGSATLRIGQVHCVPVPCLLTLAMRSTQMMNAVRLCHYRQHPANHRSEVTLSLRGGFFKEAKVPLIQYGPQNAMLVRPP